MSVIFLHQTLDVDSYPGIAITVNGTTIDAAYPSTNLQDQYKLSVMKAANNNDAQEWRFDLGANYLCDTVAILNHNLSAMAFGGGGLLFQHADDSGYSVNLVTDIITASLADPSYNTFSATAATKRYWRFLFSKGSALSAIPYMGQIFLGKRFTHAWRYSIGGVVAAPSYEVLKQSSWDGTVSAYLKHSNKIRYWGNITFQILTSAYKSDFDTWFDSVKGGYRPFLMSTDSGTTWYYVRVVEDRLPYIDQGADYWEVTLNFIEQIG